MPVRHFVPDPLAVCVAAAVCGIASPASADRIVYLAEQDFVAVPELYLVDITRPGDSLKLNKDLPWLAEGVGRFAVSPDGATIAFSADQERAEPDLFLVDITAPGRWTPVGDLPPGVREGHPKFSPDGRWLAFTASDASFGATQLYLVDLSAPGAATRMNGALAENGAVSSTGFEFTPDSSHLVYVAGELQSRYELYAVAVDEPGQSVRLNAPGGSVGDSYEGRFRVLADGRHVVYSAVQDQPGQRELHIVAIDRPGMPATLNAPFVAGGYLQEFVPSPDGRHVAYVADAETDGVPEAWLVATDLPGVARKVNAPTYYGAGLLEFTADGRYLLFAADGLRQPAERDLFMVAVDGGAAAIRLSAPLGNGRDSSRYALSADGTEVAYTVSTADGYVRDIFVARTDSPGSAVALNAALDTGAIELTPPPEFSPDSEHVAFIAVESVDSSIQELFVASPSAPGVSVRVNGNLAPGGIVLPVPESFRFLPAGAPPTGTPPADSAPTTGDDRATGSNDGGGGVMGWLSLLLLALAGPLLPEFSRHNRRARLAGTGSRNR